MKKIFLTLSLFCALSNAKAQLSTLKVGDVAPDFNIVDLEGNKHSKKEYENKYVLIKLYANWSEPCQIVEPVFGELYDKYNCENSDLKLLSIDLNGNTVETEEFNSKSIGGISKNKITISGQEGNGFDFHNNYSVDGLPTFVIIGPDGLIKAIDIENIENVESFEKALISEGLDLNQKNCLSIDNDEVINLGYKIFPNPSNGDLSLEFKSIKSEQISITISNLVGQIVYSKEYTTIKGGNTINFELENLEKGSYLFSMLDSEGKLSTLKIQIK